MNMKVIILILCIFSLSFTVFSGCEKIVEMGMTDGMVSPPDDETTSTLKVGVIRPFPNYFDFGEGVELAQAEINQAGGVLGMQVEFIYREELSGDVVQSATELIEEENVVAILGPLFSSNAVKVGPIATVPVLLGATGANVTETGDFLFLVASSNALQAKLMAQFAADELGAKTAAMIWQNKDVYSEGFVTAFEVNFRDLGGSIVVSEVYESGDTMFAAQLSAVQDANPDVLFLASFAPEVPMLINQARDIGIKSVFIGSDGWDDSLLYEILEDNAPLENSYFCTNFDPDASEFISAFEAMFGHPANGISAVGYDAMYLLKIAIEMSQSMDPDTIQAAVAAITDYEGATSISHFDEDRHPVKTVGVFQIVDGSPKPYKVVGSDIVYGIGGSE